MIAEETPGALKVHFVSVPEFLTTGTNYFTTTIDKKGGVAFDYAATNRSDALIGISRGGGVADPGPTDLSRAHGLSAATPAIYERFLGSFFDLRRRRPVVRERDVQEAVMARGWRPASHGRPPAIVWTSGLPCATLGASRRPYVRGSWRRF